MAAKAALMPPVGRSISSYRKARYQMAVEGSTISASRGQGDAVVQVDHLLTAWGRKWSTLRATTTLFSQRVEFLPVVVGDFHETPDHEVSMGIESGRVLGIENCRVLGAESVRGRALPRGGSGATGVGQGAGPAVPETEIGAGGVPGWSGMPGDWKRQPARQSTRIQGAGHRRRRWPLRCRHGEGRPMGAGNPGLRRPRKDRRFPPRGVKDVAS